MPTYLDAPDLSSTNPAPNSIRQQQHSTTPSSSNSISNTPSMSPIPEDAIHPAPTPNDSVINLDTSPTVKPSEKARKVLKQEETMDTTARRRGRFARYMMAELDKTTTRIPLAMNCFLSGFIGCVTFSATSVWVGYQTGNTVQTAAAIARTMYDPRNTLHHFRANDWQALCSLLSFVIACQVGGRFHFRLSRTSRIWIMSSVFVQMLLTIGAAVAAFYTDGPTFNLSRENPSFHNTAGFLMIALLSASMGLQGVVGESLGSGFTATVVLTSVYCQLATIKWPWKSLSPPRDDRVLSVLLFGVGGAVAHFCLVGVEHYGTLCIAAGIRLLMIPVWMMCKSAHQENRLLPTTMSRRLALTPTSTQATLVEKIITRTTSRRERQNNVA
ncbi:hypothetical protein P389DRAFT_36432 [Cystobasidium minutum MCA 4210]|uniref:uncharacterized protein n=1 Tax=Cystobasidium minutum MCA 4210 TaxID=1397322 RepID=UPI0034CDAB1E|eukprot:jgi/Rhomi1/36432/CE36431_751